MSSSSETSDSVREKKKEKRVFMIIKLSVSNEIHYLTASQRYQPTKSRCTAS